MASSVSGAYAVAWASVPATLTDPEKATRANGGAADNRGVRRWQVVALTLLVVMAFAIFIVVKFFQFVGSQN